MTNIESRYYKLISNIPFPYIDNPIFNTHGKIIIALLSYYGVLCQNCASIYYIVN